MELRQLLTAGKLPEAMQLIDELDEMAKDDKTNKIESYLRVLLAHLIKQAVEKRSTRSWEASIQVSLSSVHRSNKRRKAGGYYLVISEMREAISEIYDEALFAAALEAFEGSRSQKQLGEMVDAQQIQAQAFDLVVQAHPSDYR